MIELVSSNANIYMRGHELNQDYGNLVKFNMVIMNKNTRLSQGQRTT